MANASGTPRTELERLAEELLEVMRTAAATAAGAQQSQVSMAKLLSATAEKSARFASAAAESDDGAKFDAMTPSIAALHIVSEDLAQIATNSPALADLAVVSPEVARVAAKVPEIGLVANASPELAAMLEAALAARK